MITLMFFRSWRDTWLSISLAAGLFIAATTEILSLFHRFTGTTLIVCWVHFVSILAAAFFRQWKLNRATLDFSLKPLSLPAAFICIMLFLPGIVALLAPPNTWDSLTYHMPRVMHWIQNQSVAHYVTHNTRQLALQPWAEYTIAHLQLLTGSDRFAGLVQWFSMIGCAIGVSLISQALGATKKGQLLSALFAVTVPMTVLQASSTQTDFVVSFWLICLSYYTIRILVLGESNFGIFAALFASLALALFTKGTAYIYAIPFLMWLLLSRFRRKGLIGFFAPVFGGACVVLLLSGTFVRNTRTFGNPFGPVAVAANRDMSPRLLVSNIVRNLGMHFVTPSESVNQSLEGAIVAFHHWMGVSASPVDTTYPHTEFHLPTYLYLAPDKTANNIYEILFHEDLAGNLIHTALILCTILLWILRARTGGSETRAYTGYFLCVISTFFLFCLLLRWQPWATRLHLPGFILSSVLFGMMAAEILSNKASSVVAVLLFVVGLTWIFFGIPRPLLGQSSVLQKSRAEQYLSNKPELYPSFIHMASVVKQTGCTQIGLIMDGNSPEYPLWIYLRNELQGSFRLEHIQVPNISAKYSDGRFSPCVIIAMDPPLNHVTHGNRLFREIYATPRISVLR